MRRGVGKNDRLWRLEQKKHYRNTSQRKVADWKHSWWEIKRREQGGMKSSREIQNRAEGLKAKDLDRTVQRIKSPSIGTRKNWEHTKQRFTGFLYKRSKGLIIFSTTLTWNKWYQLHVVCSLTHPAGSKSCWVRKTMQGQMQVRLIFS